jgi:hypothetical protein
MDAVARNSHASIFKLHPKDVTGEILCGDVGMPPPSSTMYLLKLERQQLFQRAAEKRFFMYFYFFFWISAKKNVCLGGAQGLGCPSTGTNWCQSASHLLSTIKHDFNTEFHEQAVHAHDSLNCRSMRQSQNSRPHKLNILNQSNQEPNNGLCRLGLSQSCGPLLWQKYT